MSEETFQFKTTVQENLKHTEYCPYCYDEIAVPALESYNELLARARVVSVWSKNYRGFIPVLKKARAPISLDDQNDKDELVLKLGFMACELGFNGLIHTQIQAKKIRLTGKRSKLVYSATAHPVWVDVEKVNRELLKNN